MAKPSQNRIFRNHDITFSANKMGNIAPVFLYQDFRIITAAMGKNTHTKITVDLEKNCIMHFSLDHL
ncbi:hypothetical protein OW716_14630, partial [Acidithiobacillus ferriphilus]